jgi:hypothetical protein
MKASRSLVGLFINGIRVDTVRTAEVFEGADGEFARSEPVDVAIGEMLDNGVMSIGRASCWLTF